MHVASTVGSENVEYQPMYIWQEVLFDISYCQFSLLSMDDSELCTNGKAAFAHSVWRSSFLNLWLAGK